jgi:hypothetical protein
VSWHAAGKKWVADVYHGGKKEHLGLFSTEEAAKAGYDARCLELGLDPDKRQASGFRGVTWYKSNGEWKAQITVDRKKEHLGYFEPTPAGEVGAALAYDARAREAGRPKSANFEPVDAPPLPGAEPRGAGLGPAPARGLSSWAGGGGGGGWGLRSWSSASPLAAAAPTERGLATAAGAGPPGVEDVAAWGAELAAEEGRRGLVRRDNSWSSQYNGVYWQTRDSNWEAQVCHGGKQEQLGHFATEEAAKAGYDARCLELGLDPDKRQASGFRGVSWHKPLGKWRAQITVDGKMEHLGFFEPTPVGEVGAALAYDARVWAVGRGPKSANFEPVDAPPLPGAAAG